MPGTPLKAIVGLGNPGPDYAQTRHNAGFWLVDELARKCKSEFRPQVRYHGETCRIILAGAEITLLKPQTFMNKSGQSIRALSDFLKIPSTEILIAYDELDLPLGVARLKFDGGAAGHNGMRDVIAHLGAACWRLRIGIAHPGDKSEVIDHVLRRAPREEEQAIRDAISAAIDAIVVFLEQGSEKAMNELHGKTL